MDIPTREEIKAIVGALEGRWRPVLLTAIFTGLRASELRGLRWEDVDVAKRELHVRQRADRYLVIGSPKSESSERAVPLSPIVVNALREWKLACPMSDLDLVFPSKSGRVEHHATVVRRGLAPAMIRAGVTVDGHAKYTGLHALRHFYASWCGLSRPTAGQRREKFVSEGAKRGYQMVNVILVVREPGNLKPEYSLEFELPEVPAIGSYISIQRLDSPSFARTIISSPVRRP